MPINKWWKYQNWHQAQPLKCLYVVVLQLLASTSTQTTIGVVPVACIAKMPRLPKRINFALTVWVCRSSNPDSGWLILYQRSRSKINVLSGTKRSLMSCLSVDARRCASLSKQQSQFMFDRTESFEALTQFAVLLQFQLLWCKIFNTLIWSQRLSFECKMLQALNRILGL